DRNVTGVQTCALPIFLYRGQRPDCMLRLYTASSQREAPMSAQKPSTQVNVAASKGIMRPINRFLEQWIPSALTFAIVLTLIVAVIELIIAEAGPGEVVRGWAEGLAGLLKYMTQMRLILLLGHILANTGPVRSLLAGLARVPGNASFTYVFVFLVAAVASLIT